MKQFLATTALSAILMSSAAGAATLDPTMMYQSQPTDIRASEFIGSRIYATEDNVSAETAVKAGDEANWDDIGEINEVILSRQGEVEAVVLGVGGFLGIGEKDVAIPMKDVTFVKNGDEHDDYFLVVNANKQVLTDAPAYMADEHADASASMKTDATATDMNTDATATDGRTALVRPDVTKEGYTSEKTDLTADALKGASVYGAKDEDVGDVAEVLLNDDGTVKQLVLDIGGFLGMGEHRIAVNLDEVNIMRNADGDDVRVYVDSTEEALKAQPEYTGG
ncbi:PRC-barrel domain-containing protein [Agrobacterium sp. ES01]|uniref:PRC-barrel domain-containing protein n=1 Tax=Agrobacterium sp. ES01 TaxID=3420714 RepID=UPI003D0D194A